MKGYIRECIRKIKEEILKKKPKIQEASDRINNLYNLEFKKNEKLEKRLKSAREVTAKPGSLATSNKMILNKFIIQYNQEINNLEKTNENANLKISLFQLINLLSKLNFVSKDLVYPTQQQIEKVDIPNFVESKNKTQEKNLVNEIWNVLKDKEGLINKDYLFIYLLCVINIYDYFLIKINKKQFNSNEKESIQKLREKHEINKDKPVYTNEYINELNKIILNKSNEEICSKMKESKKYVGFDENNNLIVNIDMAKLIHKDFNFLNVNHSSYNSELFKKKLPENSVKLTFKPETNKNSDKLSNNFRNKIQKDVDPNNEISESHYDEKKSTLKMDYINLLLIKKKKREKIMAKKKEEEEHKELDYCTFSPKILEYILEQPRKDRFDTLFKMGTRVNQNRKDRPRAEIEVEKNGKECTFKPNLVIDLPAATSFPKEEDFEHFSYQYFYHRLKLARLEHRLKEIIHSREPFENLNEIKSMFISYEELKKKGGNPSKESKEKFEESSQNNNINNNNSQTTSKSKEKKEEI